MKLSNYVSVSGSATYFNTGSIDGVDADLNPMMMPLFDATNSGRSQLEVGLGLNFLVPSGSLKNLRIASEVKLPIYQKVEGIQMKNQVMATFGLQYAFGNHSH